MVITSSKDVLFINYSLNVTFQFVSTYESDEENEGNDNPSVDYKTIFCTWLHCLGLFIVDNIERYFYEETIFTQRILCALCGKKFLKDLHGEVEKGGSSLFV